MALYETLMHLCKRGSFSLSVRPKSAGKLKALSNLYPALRHHHPLLGTLTQSQLPENVISRLSMIFLSLLRIPVHLTLPEIQVSYFP